MEKYKSNYTAFTLAEVLITLGIIGVIAAMTIPALMNSTQNKENEVAFKKMYSNLQNVINQVTQENGGPYDCYNSTNFTECTAFWDAVLAKFGSVTKCSGGLASACQPQYKDDSQVLAEGGAKAPISMNGLMSPNTKTSYSLPDGSIMYSYNSNLYQYGLCIIDTNGFKKPNKWGYDVFMLQLDLKGGGVFLNGDYWWVYEKGGKRVNDVLMGN